MSLIEDIKKDPAGAGLAIVLPALAVVCFAIVMNSGNIEQIIAPKPKPAQRTFGPSIPPPASWLAKAPPKDVMAVPGRKIAYWARPDTRYGPTARKEPYKGIIIHYTLPARRKLTDQEWSVRLVKYQHNGDRFRGGGHFGYHFYIDGQGGIYQGAPMTYRTNHVKSRRHRYRKPGRSRALDNRNSIGITMVGGCVAVGIGLGTKCVNEDVTPMQKAAAVDLVKALKARYSLDCMVYGHGEVQQDRASFEGITVAGYIRDECMRG